jgi:hypothetical protein
MALTGEGIPYADTGVKAASGDSLPVKRNRIDLTEMSGKSAQASSFRDTPDPRSSIVATRDHDIAMDAEAPDTGLMTNQNTAAHSSGEIPYS